MKTQIKRYAHVAKWYSEIAEYIRANYEYPDLFCDILAATSPRVAISRNWRVANHIYKHWTSGKGLDLSQCMRTHAPNVRRAIRREPLSGPKVSAFAANLKGDMSQVTIDVWMLRYYGIEGSVTKKVYAELVARVTAEAQEHGYAPAEYQAIIWTMIRKQHGKKFRSFLSVADVKQGLLFDIYEE